MKPLRPVSNRTIRAILIAARREAGLTQRQLAALAKRPHSWIAKIEIGERKIFLADLFDIARAVRLQPEELFQRIVRGVEQDEWLNAALSSQAPKRTR